MNGSDNKDLCAIFLLVDVIRLTYNCTDGGILLHPVGFLQPHVSDSIQ